MLTHQSNLTSKTTFCDLFGNLLDSVVYDIELHLQTKHFSVFPSLDSLLLYSPTTKNQKPQYMCQLKNVESFCRFKFNSLMFLW